MENDFHIFFIIKLVAKVNRINFKDVINQLDIDSIIYPKYITSNNILRYVRAMENSIGSNVETLYKILDNRAEALEFRVQEESPVTGITLEELDLKKNLLSVQALPQIVLPSPAKIFIVHAIIKISAQHWIGDRNHKGSRIPFFHPGPEYRIPDKNICCLCHVPRCV